MTVATTKTAPYGTWESPITAEMAAAAGGGPGWVELSGGRVWWAESRPLDGGRVTVVHRAVDGTPGEEPVEALPPGWNARNRLHEYGGKPFTVVDGVLVFTHWDDQRLYAVRDGGEPRPLTPAPAREHGLRYGDLVAAPGGDAVWCVRETITGDSPTDVWRELVSVPLDGSGAGSVDASGVASLDAAPAAVRVLGGGHRFLTAPRCSPDGRHAAWIGWDHPLMPWDGTELCVAEITADGTFGPHRVLAGGPTEAVCQVQWDGTDALLAMTDPDGWWNLHRLDLHGGAPRNLLPVAEELGGALWRPGQAWFAPLGGGRYAVLRTGRLAVLDEAVPDQPALTDVPSEFDCWSSTLCAEGGVLAGIAGGPQREMAAVAVDLSGPAPVVTELSQPPRDLPDAALLPRPVELMFAAPDGAQVPAYVYPPTNPAYEAPEGERPPFLVHVHGGPTSRSTPLLNMEIAFFTSRGFGVVAPNYGGSTGHGRAFRERLREQWGVVDVQDCAAVARALAADGVADGDRLAIRGGSAGGWTVAAALTAEGPPVYRCGTCMYPIIDLTTWVAGEDGTVETHDMESHYLHSLIGPLPDTHDRYVERSPINHLDRMAGPILLLQGLDDQICPPAQARRLVDALDGSGIPHAYLAFEGEQHGFRKAETIVAALDAELSFYGQVLGFDPPGVKPLELTT